MARRQGTHWLATIPHNGFTPWLPPGVSYIKGQLEEGEGGFLHWQVVVYFSGKKSLRQCRELFGPFHFEITRSAAAEDYVWKEETRVDGTQFELGSKPIRRDKAADWEQVWDAAKRGEFECVPADIRIRSFFALRAIRAEYMVPIGEQRKAYVFWGATGTGKSRKAWRDAGDLAYPKDPRSKFWDGYGGQRNVVCDEFRGDIDISHVLRWLDRYPVRVEIKGSSVPLCAREIWFTSNIHPASWWPQLDAATLNAFYRRVEIVFFE